MTKLKSLIKKLKEVIKNIGGFRNDSRAKKLNKDMRLAAVYFINNKRLGDKTLNFGGKYFYNITLKGHFTILITREENRSFIEGFYHDKISSIAAIVGQNGSGKTTILKHIKNKNQEAFFIYEHGDFEYIVHQKKSGLFELEETFVPLLKLSFEDNIYLNDRIFSEIEEYIDSSESRQLPIKNISKIKCFYYSVLSNYNNELKVIDDFIIKDHDNDIINIDNGIKLRQINFLFNLDLIAELKKVYSDFPSYDSLSIIIKDKFINEFRAHDALKFSMESTSKNDAPDDYKSFFFELNKLYKNATSDKIRVFVCLYYRFFFSFMMKSNYSLAKIIGDIEKEFSNAKEQIESDSISIDLFKNLISAFGTSIEFKTSNLEESLNSIIFKVEQFVGINNFKDIQFGDLEVFMKSYFELLVLLENNSNNDNRPKNLNFLTFKPNKRLSLGEESLLNFFSAIYDNKKLDCNSIILLLDEPELGFHPEWKKKFINSIVNILPLLYHELQSSIENIQIVFTTHDALTLSDLPSKNLLYLNKMKDNQIQLYEGMHQKTFATNVNEILANSFFLNNELIGDFAKEKIEIVIFKLNYFKLLNQKNKIDLNPEMVNNKEILEKINSELKELINKHNIVSVIEDINNEYLDKNIFKTINLIGEPVIKYKLLEMYEEVFELNKEDKAQKIKNMMNELGITIGDL